MKSQNLSREEIIKKLNENPSVAIAQIKQGLIDEMQGAITTLEQALEDDKASGGSWWLTSIINSISNDINASNIQSKKEMLSKAVESGDIESLLNAHTVLTDEISATNAIKEYNDALNYSSSISQDDIGKVLTTLGYIGNLMEYNITEQDGVIKEGIAYLNMYFDIGTNRKEAEAYVQTFKDDVNNLVKKYQNGTLTNEELVSEYKRLTGNSFTENNIRTILDNVRDNDAFENNAQEKTQDYQQTQQTIMQVGEYTITIVAGTAVTLVSGGAAGPAIAAGLSALGKMGIALTATTVSFITKTAIDATERQTNGITADDMTPEEIATSAALMYAGCLCGQFGNAVGDYIQGAAPEFLSQYISSAEMVNIVTKVAGKTLEIGSDTAASVLTTSMITGSGEWNEEFMQNLRSEMIGLIQSKITGAYFKTHPDLQINTQLYSMRKGLAGATEAEANIQVLKQFGFSDNDAVKLSTLTNDEVDTIVLLKATNDLCEASLKSHGIDISKLSAEEKIEQGKIVDDLYANADKIKQQTDNTCSVVSVLNAISDKPILLQALANKFEYDAANDTYKFNMFGEEFDVKMKDGDNLLQKAYEAYQIQYGDTKTSAIDVFNAMLDGSCDILVRQNNDIVQTLKEYTEDDSSILTFNTSDKIDGISSGHSYTVLSVDDMGNMHLQDPYTLEEITLIRSDYENKDCQIQGKTYKDSGIVENGVELKLAAGAKISDEELTIKYMEMDTAQRLAYLKDNSEFSRNLTKSEADFVLQEDFSPEEIQKMLDLLDNPEYKDTLSLSNGEHISHIIKEDLSAAETKKYVETVRLENFWDNTIISIKNYYFFYYSTVEQSIGEWLSTTFGVKPADIKQDALKFALKLNPKIIQKLTRFGRHNDYLANLLRKEDVFYDTDFDAISKNADFINYLSETTVDGKNLLSQVNNVAFLINKDFDTEGMTRLIETFKNIRITQPETNKYNFSMFLNLADGYNSITDILNSSTVDPYKAAEFLETLASTKITKSNGAQWSFTDILKEKWLYDSLFDKTIDYDKVTELCKYISELNMFPNLDEDDMSQIKWLVSNVSTTKYSNSHEYLDAYIYFKNLTAGNENKIFTGRYGRMSQEGILYYMLNINPGSVEASNAEMLIRLVQDGVVGKHIFEYLPSGGKLSPTVESDLDKLYEAYSLGIEPIDAFVPKFKSAAEAVMGGNDSISFKDTYLEVKVGDVFQVEGEDFIRIKTSDTESEQLNITRETYFKLFPPIERFASTQNDIGNCWEITGINSLLCESDTRASVLKLFSQDGDDIVIKFPNGEYEEIRFKNGELPETANDKYYSQGALGIKMLEYADGKEMQGELINKAYKKIKDMIANAPNNNTRESFEKGLAEFTKFVENHDENICINFINGVHWEEYSGRFDNIISDLRNDGGQSNNLYAKLGYKDAKCLCIYNNDGSWEKAQKLLKDSSSFDDYIISWASDGNGIENSVNSELGIVTNHAYRIKPATINNDGTVATFKLINPWGIVETELTYEQVLKYGKALYIAKKEF